MRWPKLESWNGLSNKKGLQENPSGFPEASVTEAGREVF